MWRLSQRGVQRPFQRRTCSNVTRRTTWNNENIAPGTALHFKPDPSIRSNRIPGPDIVYAILVGKTIPGFDDEFPKRGQTRALRVCDKKAPANSKHEQGKHGH